MNAEKRQQAIRRMKELSGILKEASRAYYAEDREIMSNQEYDSLYDQLEQLEKEKRFFQRHLYLYCVRVFFLRTISLRNR